jgi:nitroreductase
VLAQEESKIVVVRDTPFGCIGCGHCMMVCPTAAIHVTGRKTGPERLVDLPSREETASIEAFEGLCLRRRSVRRFSDRSVSRADLERIVAAAATAPMGIPPWEVGVTVLEGRDRVRAFSADVIGSYRGLLRFVDRNAVRWLMRVFLRRSTYEQWTSFILPLARELVGGWDRGEDLLHYDAPALLLFHTSTYADTADAVIACTYAMLAAEAMGLGTTMIGSVAPAISRNRKVLEKAGIPKGNRPQIVLIVGLPAAEFRKGIRRPFASVTWSSEVTASAFCT